MTATEKQPPAGTAAKESGNASKDTAPATTIRVYSSMKRDKEPLTTVRPGQVGIYLCGPTVYKPSHIGHMVGPVIFDVIKRYLRYSGYQVTLVVNITDVDDKLIAESQKRGITMAQVAQEMTDDYMTNLAAMGVDTIDHFPKATDNIGEIIRFTEQLIERGFAYAAGGDVYFDVARDREYGKLSGRSAESMLGEGGGAADKKRSPGDFALWKGAKSGEPSWSSPWGPGRPGWHIECSAMSRRLLGETFDIHGGGLDLIFPHHENEVAQSECCHGKPMARYWLHNGLMQSSAEVGKVGGRNSRAIEGDLDAQMGQKISKSTGAGPFRDLLKQYAPETIRYFLISTHYRRPIEFSDDQILEKHRGLEQFYRFFARFQRITGGSFYDLSPPVRRPAPSSALFGSAADDETTRAVAAKRKGFIEAMDDDFNTGGAVAALFDLLRTLNAHIDATKLEAPGAKDEKALASLTAGATTLRELALVLGLFLAPVEQPKSADSGLVDGLMRLLIDLRAESRLAKNFAVADRIRKTLTELGVTLEDRADGTTWSVQR